MVKILIVTEEKEKWIEKVKANMVVKNVLLSGNINRFENEMFEVAISEGGEHLRGWKVNALILDIKVGTKIEQDLYLPMLCAAGRVIRLKKQGRR